MGNNPPRPPRMALHNSYTYPYIEACFRAEDYNRRLPGSPSRIIARIRLCVEMDPQPGKHYVKNVYYFNYRRLMATDEWKLFAEELAMRNLVITYMNFEHPDKRVPRDATHDLVVYVHPRTPGEQRELARRLRAEGIYK